MKRSPVGVIQGRLLPKYQGRYQCHPVGYWSEEFKIVAELDLDCIQFILNSDNIDMNPLSSAQGLEKINGLVNSSGVKVSSICADYFMEKPLHKISGKELLNAIEVLKKLVKSSKKIGSKSIVLPCLDNSSFSDLNEMKKFQELISDVIPIAEDLDINIALETDLDSATFSTLLEAIDSSNLTVNYDIGNSASFGHDVKEDFSAYGEKISDVHIKDRPLGKKSIRLGDGDANFEDFFKLMDNSYYSGPFIMETYRDEEGVNIFKQQLSWLREKGYV